MTNIWSHCARYNVNAQWTNEERCESDRCGSTVLQDLATHNVALQLRSKASLHQNNQYLCETSCWLTMNDAVAKCYCKPPFAMPTSWSPLHAVTQQLPNRSQSLKNTALPPRTSAPNVHHKKWQSLIREDTGAILYN
jgi:hypothetical protein